MHENDSTTPLIMCQMRGMCEYSIHMVHSSHLQYYTVYYYFWKNTRTKICKFTFTVFVLQTISFCHLERYLRTARVLYYGVLV